MDYVRTVRFGSANVRVLLPQGITTVISRRELVNSHVVPTEVTNIPPYEYVHVMRSGRNSTSLLLADGSTILIPTHTFRSGLWHRSEAEIEANSDAHNPLRDPNERREERSNHTDSSSWEHRWDNFNSHTSSTQERPVRRRRRRRNANGELEERPVEPAYVHPENQIDRVYSSIKRNGSRTVTVYMLDGTLKKIPREYFDSWICVTDQAYWTMILQREAETRTFDDLTFGVEIEFVANPDKFQDFILAMEERVGSSRFIHPMRYGQSSTTQWSLQTDSSVRSTSQTLRQSGYELTSPILKHTPECRRELADVLSIITTVFEGTVNRTCGTHIHIGGFTQIQHTRDFIWKIRQLQSCYGILEETVWDRITSPSRRGSGNHYCQSLKDAPQEISSRYYKMNAENIFGFGTMENRQHQGTLDITKIWNWMELNGRFILSFWKGDLDYILTNRIAPELENFLSQIGCSTSTISFFISRRDELN